MERSSSRVGVSPAEVQRLSRRTITSTRPSFQNELVFFSGCTGRFAFVNYRDSSIRSASATLPSVLGDCRCSGPFEYLVRLSPSAWHHLRCLHRIGSTRTGTPQVEIVEPNGPGDSSRWPSASAASTTGRSGRTTRKSSFYSALFPTSGRD